MVASALNLGPSATLTDGDLVKLPVGACLDSAHHKATSTAQKIAAKVVKEPAMVQILAIAETAIQVTTLLGTNLQRLCAGARETQQRCQQIWSLAMIVASCAVLTFFTCVN